MHHPSRDGKKNDLVFKALSFRHKNRPYFRKTGCDPAVVRWGMADLQEYQRRFVLFY